MKAKKNPARAFSVALALMTVLVSCGEGGNPDEMTSAPETTGSESTESTAVSGEVSSLPEKFDLEDYEFRLLRQTPSEIAWSLNEFAPDEQSGEVLSDAFYNRNQKVKEKYNFRITVTDNASKTRDLIRTSVLAGDDEYDAALIRIDEEKNAYDGTYLNLRELPYLDLEKSWWSQSLINDMTIGGVLPFITGDIYCLRKRFDVHDDVQQRARRGFRNRRSL